MRKMIAAAALLGSLTLLAGCGTRDDPNTPNEQENAELNNISEMLDASPDSATANEDAPLGNGEEPVETEDPAANEAAGNSGGNAQ